MIDATPIIYEYYCPRCRKNHQVECNPEYITSKEIEYIECICERKISVITLIYLYKSKKRNEIKNYKIL